MKKLALLLLILVLLLPVAGCAAAPPKPVVLLTDFGTDDYRVPRLKGIIYSAAPDVEIIDATHGITSLDIAAGAYVLDLTAKEFPADVVFIACVGSSSDPNVQYLAVRNDRGQIFVAPNDGLLTYIINEGVKETYAITNTALFDRPEAELSSHYILGRVGALIANGRAISDAGPAVSSPVLLDIQKPAVAAGELKGSVVFIDHYGNCLTNITGENCRQAGLAVGDALALTVNGKLVPMVYGTGYKSVATGEAVAYVNSLGVMQLSLNAASFSAANGVKTGMNMEIAVTAAAPK